MFLPTLEEADLKPFQDVMINTPDEEAVEPEDLVDCFADGDLEYDKDDDDGGPSNPPEMLILLLLSNISSAKIQPALQSLVSIEVELQKGQANDALEGLRISWENKSLLLQTNVNNSTSTKQSTRAWASVRNAQSQILQHANDYQRVWQAITCLGTPEDLSIYQKLKVRDLVVVKDITKAKRFGQGSDSLSWFWRIGPSQDSITGEWMEECKFYN